MTARKSPGWHNRQRTLVFASRGISYRVRHLVNDVRDRQADDSVGPHGGQARENAAEEEERGRWKRKGNGEDEDSTRWWGSE